jgi:ABC-type branched-subunit amino acid transport system ATPase component
MDGHNVSGLATARRARLGLGRTFQQTELFPSMTVLENLTLGCEASIAGASPWSQIAVRRAERAACSSAVAQAIELCHLQDLLRVPAAALSTGQRRMVEIARCIAGPVKVLLLDEPSAGLDPAETTRLGQILQLLSQERGLGVLLVEHDMDLVMDICDYIYVLDFGRLIFEGDPSSVQASEVVRLAYLGEPLSDAGEPSAPVRRPEEIGR